MSTPTASRPTRSSRPRRGTRRATSIAAGSACVALGLSVALAPMAAARTAAQAGSSVDESALTPALNPTYAWSCTRTGGGITCTGERRTAYGPEPAGFDCDGQPVWVSGRGDDRATRWHTADGLATRTISHRSFPEDRLTLTPDGSGPEVVSRQHWTQQYQYGVPGDVGTRVLVEVGQVLMVHGGRAGGKVFQLTGRTEFAPGEEFETVVSAHGPNDFAAGHDFVDEVCGALT